MSASLPPVLVVGLNGQVVGLEAQTGATLWSHEISSGLMGNAGLVELAVTSDRVYAIGTQPQLTCIEYPSGALLGRVELPRGLTWGRLVVQDHWVYVISRGEVACIDPQGRVVWHQQLNKGILGGSYGQVSAGFPGNVRAADRDSS